MFRSYIKSYEEALSKTEPSDPNHSYLESIVLHSREQLAQRKAQEESEAWIFPQALRILANMWGSVDPLAPSQTMKRDWRSFVEQMEGKWSRKMLKALLFLAAMLSCQLPISAVDWAQELFVPIKVCYTTWDPSGDIKDSFLLGFLNKQAFTEDSSLTQKPMLATRRSTGIIEPDD